MEIARKRSRQSNHHSIVSSFFLVKVRNLIKPIDNIFRLSITIKERVYNVGVFVVINRKKI